MNNTLTERQTNRQTGYPSVDKPWLKFYKPGAEEASTMIPTEKTVWDVIEKKLWEYKDIPAIEYFGRVISRPEFIDLVYTWAKAFQILGIEENEIVPYYGPFLPDVGAMAFALNILGACTYFLKIPIPSDSLAEETKESRFAIVFEDMWDDVCSEFTKDRFQKVIVISAIDGMACPKKQILSIIKKVTEKERSKHKFVGNKYLRLNQAKNRAKLASGHFRAPFIPNRDAFITSSSGTTVGGIIKGTVATNESAIAQLIMGDVSEIQYFPGDVCLDPYPPTASTALNTMFLLPLYKGMKIIMDPRISETDFYNQILTYHPNIVLTTGSAWELFFNRIDHELKKGKTFDFSYAKGWTIGGEGTDVKKYKSWNRIMHICGGSRIYSGYGASELFSAVCVEKTNAKYDCSKSIMSVGIPYAGIIMGVYDKDGNELKYGERGELWVKSKSAMKEYYNKPELTSKTLVDGWIHTGDLAEIDENGFVYIWGRMNDIIMLPDGHSIFLFDIAKKIKDKNYINDAIVLPLSSESNKKQLVAHIVWMDKPAETEKIRRINELNAILQEFLPSGLTIIGYAEHDKMLPYLPTALKKDKNKMIKQTTGFYQVQNDKLEEIII